MDGDSDDEEINRARIDLTKIPSNVSKIDIVASIYEGDSRGLEFSMIPDARIKILDSESDSEIFDASFRDFSEAHTIKIGSLTRQRGR